MGSSAAARRAESRQRKQDSERFRPSRPTRVTYLGVMQEQGKYLLVTSDDFGMTHSINRGIQDALKRGIVGATNLMVPCPWFADAAARTSAHQLPAGIHLTLTCEWDRYRWRPLTSSPRLRADDGGMHRAYAKLPPDLTSQDIRAEFDAQLRELRRKGVAPTHVDTHMMASFSTSEMELRVKDVVRQLCKEEGLVYTYDTDDDGRLRYFSSETMFSPLTEDELRERLSSLGAGVHHVICHCALASEEQRSLCSPDESAFPWAEEYRVKDHRTVVSEDFRAFVQQQEFELLDMRSFLDLAGSSPKRP